MEFSPFSAAWPRKDREGREEDGELTLTSLTIGELHCNQGLAPNPWEKKLPETRFQSTQPPSPLDFPSAPFLWERSRGVGPVEKVPRASQRAKGGLFN